MYRDLVAFQGDVVHPSPALAPGERTPSLVEEWESMMRGKHKGEVSPSSKYELASCPRGSWIRSLGVAAETRNCAVVVLGAQERVSE
jgi:hypothetical protein